MPVTSNKSTVPVAQGNANGFNTTENAVAGGLNAANVSYTVTGASIKNLNLGKNNDVVSGAIDFQDFAKSTLQSKGQIYGFTGLWQTLPAGSIDVGDLGITLSAAGDSNQQQLFSGTVAENAIAGWALFFPYGFQVTFTPLKGETLAVTSFQGIRLDDYNITTKCKNPNTNVSFTGGSLGADQDTAAVKAGASNYFVQAVAGDGGGAQCFNFDLTGS